MEPKARITRGTTAESSITPRLKEVDEDTSTEESDAAATPHLLSGISKESESGNASADAQQ